MFSENAPLLLTACSYQKSATSTCSGRCLKSVGLQDDKLFLPRKETDLLYITQMALVGGVSAICVENFRRRLKVVSRHLQELENLPILDNSGTQQHPNPSWCVRLKLIGQC
ncbi:uncharacterized protein LOC129754730 [Uranotaenia lowii]|uniref:uncharacterized protein LOC129754730 n=1 Tax=Uranotaenia lowii TaxID=190385 RepID=UPI00247A7BBF|nr:uncharacterized protein LOC129754730 [Uranotaenia lowii]